MIVPIRMIDDAGRRAGLRRQSLISFIPGTNFPISPFLSRAFQIPAGDTCMFAGKRLGSGRLAI